MESSGLMGNRVLILGQAWREVVVIRILAYVEGISRNESRNLVSTDGVPFPPIAASVFHFKKFYFYFFGTNETLPHCIKGFWNKRGFASLH